MESMTRDQLNAVFEKVVETCEKKLYDPKLNGVNWRQIADGRKERILAGTNDADVEREFNELIKELKVSHAGFYHERRPRAAGKMAISATLFKTEDEDRACWVFQDVHPGGAAFKAGIQPGDILVRVRDEEIRPPNLPLFPLGEATPVDICRRDGSHVRLTVDVPKSKTKERPLIELQPVSHAKNDGVGWLKVCMFPGAIGIDVAHDIDKAVESLDCERLVIDLRGNTGGGIGCLRLMSYLTEGRIPVGYSVTRRRAEQGFSKEKLPVFDHIPSKKIGLLGLALKFVGRDQSVVISTEGLGKQRFHGKVVLLVNEHSASSCEMVAAFATENKLATIVGSATPGRLLGGHSFRVGHGYRIAIPVAAYYTWNGTFLEGKGVAPDVEEPFSVSAIRNGCDAQLQRAMDIARML
jgi:C-terminal processing protease CtpA/Prc